MQALTGDHIAQLGDEDLRKLVVSLCEAELRKTKHPASAVVAGGNQTAKDGGIDVRIELPKEAQGGLDFVPRPATGFQVKCEDMRPKAIEKEMRPNGKLRESIKELITQDGAYVIVCSQGTVSDLFLQKRRNAMVEAVKDEADASRLKLDFYDRDRLARWVGQYSGVELWIRDRIGERLQGWQPFAAWAGGELGTPYFKDDTARVEIRTPAGRKRVSVSDGADILREKLRKPGGVVRLIGLSGTGKTRLIQALFETGLGTSEPLDAALVCYTDLGHSPEPGARDMLVYLGSKAQRAIVLVDNCSSSTHNTLTEVATKYAAHLSLVTVEFDVGEEDAPEATQVFELSPTSEDVLRSIVARLAPQLARADLDFIISVSGGNARVALALARTVQQGESLGALNDSEVFRRLFRQGQADDPNLQRAAEVCSLVYSFDVERTDENSELHILAGLAEMTMTEFYRHIDTLRRRELVQSRSRWRALLPPALANRFAKAALRSIPRNVMVGQLTRIGRLLESFATRLEYLDDSEAACAIASSWLDDSKWLRDFAALGADKRRLLQRVAPLAPGKVLSRLELAVSAQNLDRFLATQKSELPYWGRLAGRLAHDPEDFDRAAGVLLLLAELEEGNHGHCREAFRQTFRLRHSGVLAKVERRIAFLQLALARAGGTERRQALVQDAVAALLEIGEISPSHLSFGSRARAYGWEPETPEEIVSWLRQSLLLARQVAQSGSKGRAAVQTALAANFHELWAEPVREDLNELITDLSSGGDWPAGWVAVRRTIRFNASGMPAPLLANLKTLAGKLAPQDIAQETFAYVISDALAKPLRTLERTQEKASALGRAASANKSVLEQVLPQLHQVSKRRSVAWGAGFGSASDDPNGDWAFLRQTYLQAGQKRNVGVLQGFFIGLRRRDRSAADGILDGLIEDLELAVVFPVILGMPYDDRDGDRLLRAVTTRDVFGSRSRAI